MSATAARQHPWRNVVTRALSGGGDPEIGHRRALAVPGERYLLCSDGLSGVVPNETIAACSGRTTEGSMASARGSSPRPTKPAGPTNITVLVLEVDAP